MLDVSIVIVAVSLAAWLYLWVFRGKFWQIGETLEGEGQVETGFIDWPSVAVVIPARNEAEVLPRTLPAVLGQNYPGDFHVYLVDDHSDDGTGVVALDSARTAGQEDRLTVVPADPLCNEWTGKLWALDQGIVKAGASRPDFLLLTDADIFYSGGDDLQRLVWKALEGQLDLVSLMVRLRVKSFWERMLIPAFVYFFAMLYPFAWARDPHRKLAAAAGGCLLVGREALEKAGGLAPIRGELIDDCSLAALIKGRGGAGGGRIWLGLSRSVLSLRAYEGLGDIWKMVARTAFVQLKYSYLLLAGTVAGMVLVFLVPPLATLAGLAGAWAQPGEGNWWVLTGGGLAAWMLMAGTFFPMARWYGLPWIYCLLHPLSAAFYTLMTLDSARRFRHGGGGLWKGRTYPAAGSE
jgi:hopene-associated glycosyltransferase HpnB